MESFVADIVVIGAGSAGATLAGRLAMETRRRIILIEAGGGDGNPVVANPMATGMLVKSHSLMWRHKTEPEPQLANRRLDAIQARIMGGGSSVNGMVWLRGRPSDYDGWAQGGLPSWNWTSVNAAFERLERRGGEAQVPGAIAVSQDNRDNPLIDAFLKAAAQAGYAQTPSLNAEPFEGAARIDNNIVHGRRSSATTAFLKPALRRSNLIVIKHAFVNRIVIDDGRVAGVLAEGPNGPIDITAAEVVVSAGALASPRILMLSGIGPGQMLRSHGITVHADLPGVGENFQDHLCAPVGYEMLLPVSLKGLARLDKAALSFAQAHLLGTGPAARGPFGAAAIMRSSPDQDQPDLQCLLVPVAGDARLHLPFTYKAPHAFTLAMFQLRPQSRGRVGIYDANPASPPKIEANVFSHPEDRAVLRAAIRIGRQIAGQPAMAPYRGRETFPGEESHSDDQLNAWISNRAVTAYHPVGTCKMGSRSDPFAVVDADLKVRGVQGLRVADASIMPTITSGNTNAPSIMIGYRCADIMLSGL